MPPDVLPHHRVPFDDCTHLKLAVGHFLLCRDQTVEEALEVAAYLGTWLSLVDPREGNCRREMVFLSRGMMN